MFRVPPASAFIVKADGVEVTVQDVLGSSLDTLLLNPSSTIGARQIVTVSYAVPTTGTVIEDLAGNDALAFEDFPVTNNSTVANTTAPVPASAVVPASGASLTLTFNEDLDIAADRLPPATAFSVTADGVDVPVQSVTAGSGADSFVLDLGADAINQCQTVTVDYEAPTTNPIQDTDDNAAVGFHRLRGRQQLHGRVSQPQRSGVRGRRPSGCFPSRKTCRWARTSAYR